MAIGIILALWAKVHSNEDSRNDSNDLPNLLPTITYLSNSDFPADMYYEAYAAAGKVGRPEGQAATLDFAPLGSFYSRPLLMAEEVSNAECFSF